MTNLTQDMNVIPLSTVAAVLNSSTTVETSQCSQELSSINPETSSTNICPKGVNHQTRPSKRPSSPISANGMPRENPKRTRTCPNESVPSNEAASASESVSESTSTSPITGLAAKVSEEVNTNEETDGGFSPVTDLFSLCHYSLYGTPKVAYKHLPPYHIPPGQLKKIIPHNTFRFELEADFPVFNSKLCDTVTENVVQQLNEWSRWYGYDYSLSTRCTVTIHTLANQRLMDIKWPCISPGVPTLHSDDPGPRFKPDVNYNNSSKTAVFQGAGPQGDLHNITIGVDLRHGSNINQFRDAFNQELEIIDAGFIVDIWRIWIKDTFHIPECPESGQCLSRLVLLVTLYDRSASKPRTLTRNPQKSAKDLPGYIDFEGQSIYLHYLHRLPWCHYCREDSRSFHTRDRCTRAPCICISTDHTTCTFT
jgi:hypothetical protein